VPTKSKELNLSISRTYQILLKIFEEYGFEKELVPIYTSMKLKESDWKYQVEAIEKLFVRYSRVSFLTLGDAAIYSSIYYLIEYIKKSHEELYKITSVIPGVSSFSQGSAMIKKPLCLGQERLIISPLYSETKRDIRVFMRAKNGSDTKELNLSENSYIFDSLNFEGESISKLIPNNLEKYLSFIIDFGEEREL
jgi:precorrin-2/cobalt-factor-2 C20-methyltransferase